MVRYPHKGTVSIVTGKVKDANGHFTTETEDTDVTCRVDLGGGNKSYDYSGKVYLPKFDSNLVLQTGTFTFEGKKFEIVRGHNYQTHTELWLQ